MNMNFVYPMLAFLAYDENEERFCRKVKTFFPHAKFHFRKSLMVDLFGVVEIDGVFYIWIRGTGEGIKPWLRNIIMFTGGDGSHNGFECSAKKIFHPLQTIMDTGCTDTFKLVGHSAATGIIPILQMLITKEFGIRIPGYGFGVVPPGNERFRTEYIKSRNTFESWSSHGDPYRVRFRRKGTMLFDGRDVDVVHVLPKLKFWEDWRMFRLLSHSPRRMCDRLWRHGDFTGLYHEFVWLKKLCVN